MEVAYKKPHKNYDQWSEEHKKSANIDAKVMNALFCVLNKEEFNMSQWPLQRIKFGIQYM